MVKPGDIIVVRKYISEDGKLMRQHSFLVIGNDEGIIKGLKYDMVANVISSFKGEEHRTKKLKYIENLEIKNSDIITSFTKNGKDGYIKLDQLFYFNSKKLDYYSYGCINNEILKNVSTISKYLYQKGKRKNNYKNL